MTRHGRAGLSLSHCFILALVVALIPVAALASIPVITPQTPTEVVSARTYQMRGPDGQTRTVQDLAISGRILAQVAPNMTPQQFNQLLAVTGCSLIHQYRTPGLVLLGLPAGVTVNQGINRLQGQLMVQAGYPDRLMYPTVVPNDPDYGLQYHWPLIDAPQGWDVQSSAANVVVAVIDSGVDRAHEDLASRIWNNAGETPGNGLDDDGNGFADDVNGWDFASGNNDPSPNGAGAVTFGEMQTVRHGTHVAGAIGAATNNGVGVAGHAWNCQIMSVQVFGLGATSDDVVLAAYDYAVANGAKVINMSLGGGYSDVWTAPITNAYNQGVVTVVAAGNSAMHFLENQPASWSSPVCNDGPSFLDNHVIGVGATDSSDVCAWFTNLDSTSRSFVDVMAPGVGIWSTYYFNPLEGFNSKYGFMDGTSMACPVTAGLVALIRAHFPSLPPGGVVAQLRGGCENIDAQNPGEIGDMGAGRINSFNSMADQPPGAPRSPMAFDTPNDNGGSITVSWNTSLDDGRGFNDVTGYEVWRATDVAGPFSMLATLPKGTKGYVDTPVPDYTDFFYQIYALDPTQRTASKVTQPAQARDDTAPGPVTVTATDSVADDGGSISLTWGSYAPPPDFAAYRVYRSDTSFTDVTADGVTLLDAIGNSNTKFYQDNTTTDNKDYWYAVTCIDTSLPPNELKEVTAAGPVRSNPNYAFGFMPGLSLMSIGLTLQNNELDDVFSIANGTPAFARWDPNLGTNGAYVGYVAGSPDPFLHLIPGRGFWMRSAVPIALSLSGAAAPADTRIDFVPGWNSLGNPYTGDVNVATAGTGVRIGGTFYTLAQSNAQDYTRDFFWIYDSFASSYKLISETLPFSTPVIHKGEGFFFLANRIGQLVLKNPSPLAVAGVAPAKANVAWSLRLVASIDGAADTDNFLGVSSQAAQISNIASPPAAGDGPDLCFTGAYTRAATAFVESLGPGQTWTAEVSCARPGAVIKLSWPDLSALPRDTRPMLVDTTAGRSIYMRTSTGYSFTLGPEEASRAFTIEIDTKAGDTLAIRSLQTESAPGSVRVSYSLSAAATVEVEVRNLAGRLVRRLGGTDVSAAGAHQVLWNCTSASGQKVPAGRYLITVIGRADNGQVVQALQAVQVRR